VLVRFHSKASGSVTMFGEVAKALLELMGMSGSVPGAVLAADVPDALRRLKQGLAAPAPNLSARERGDEEEEDRAISLKTRAVPLIQLLEAAAKRDCDVVWEEEGKATG